MFLVGQFSFGLKPAIALRPWKFNEPSGKLSASEMAKQVSKERTLAAEFGPSRRSTCSLACLGRSAAARDRALPNRNDIVVVNVGLSWESVSRTYSA